MFFPLHTTEINTSELVELLQKYALKHLTTYRQLEVQDFGSVATTVTTDFEALYAYKHGDYQQCLLLSAQNVNTLLYAVLMFYVKVAQRRIPRTLSHARSFDIKLIARKLIRAT